MARRSHHKAPSRDAFALGLVLKNLDNFDITTFSGRLVLQKTIYLMQAFGVYLGYEFGWYLHGPYSTTLTRHGFELRGVYRHVPRGSFDGKTARTRFSLFLRFMEDKQGDADRLELLSSIHFLKKLYPRMRKSGVLKKVQDKQQHFTKAQCAAAWDELRNEGLIS